MSKRMAQSGKIWLSHGTDSTLLRWIVGGLLGVGLLVAESAVLSSQGVHGIAYALVSVFAASTVSSIAGFAFSALSGALLFHLLDSPVYAVHVMIICSIAIQLLSVAALWRAINWSALSVFLIGGFPGVPVGVYFLLHLSTAAYKSVIGSLLIAYGCYLLLRRPVCSHRLGPLSDVCAGFLGGITGGLAGFPGAFVTIWCGLKGWDKARQRGVYQPFILGMQPVTLVAIRLMGPSASNEAQLDWKTFAFVPAAMLGAWFGLCIFNRLSDRQFELVVIALLIASGIGLVI